MERTTLEGLSKRILQIRPGFQDYDWGMPNEDCFVARMTEKESDLYAEVWYGDHKNGSAVCLDSRAHEIPLNLLIPEAPQLFLGVTTEWYEAKLPLMAKILSVKRPLSIQVHPGKEDAVRLHSLRPQEYPDPHPKNEAGIALTNVELLYGFLPFKTIAQHVEDVPEFANLIGDTFSKAKELAEKDEAAAIKMLFAEVWNSSDADVQTACTSLYIRLESLQSVGLSDVEDWALRMEKYYPKGDPGVFGFFLMKLVRLRPWQGIAIPTGCPHAYLAGELIEVMMPSDMVIRCGLTPKFRDDKELLNCSDFTPVTSAILEGERLEGLVSYAFESGLTVEVLDQNGNFATSSRPEILLSLDAVGKIRFADQHQIVAPTKAFLVPSGVPNYSVDINSGRVIRFRRS